MGVDALDVTRHVGVPVNNVLCWDRVVPVAELDVVNLIEELPHRNGLAVAPTGNDVAQAITMSGLCFFAYKEFTIGVCFACSDA